MTGLTAFLAAQALLAATPGAVNATSPTTTPAPAPAATSAPAPAATAQDPLLTAEVLLARNDLEPARTLLEELEAHPSPDRARTNQVQFLLGLLDLQDKDYDSAITRFRRILVSEPNTVRVRLEMGRAYFLAGRYADAEQQFMYARAGKVPPAVLANIDRFLGAIRQLKTFTYGFSIAIAPDTNVNAGPATDAVTLCGLPFQLSPNAKANSGVGLVLDTNAEWAPRIGPSTGPRMKWRVGGLLHRVQYRETDFDDMTLGLYTGPHLTLKRWDLNLLGNVSRRWYGDRGYTKSYGPSADATYYLTTRLGLGLAVNLNQTDYEQNAQQNGLGHSVTLSSFYTPTTSSYMRGAVTFGRQDAALAGYAFDSRQYGLTYVREFAGGITASISPAITHLAYDAPLAGVGDGLTPRRDWQYSAQVSVLYRRIDWEGLTPKLSYTYTKNDSNLGLYTFHRSHFEIGFTKSF